MKALFSLFSISFILFSSQSYSQNYQATYTVGKSWQTSYVALPGSWVSSGNDSIYCASNVSLEGQQYAAVVSESRPMDTTYFREDLTTGEVFFFNPTDTLEYPYMDLSAQVGDTVLSFIPWTKAGGITNGDDSLIVIVDRFKVEDLQGDSLIVLEYENCAGMSWGVSSFYVEKVGSLISPTFARYPCNISDIPTSQSHCAYDNGVQFFMNWQTDSCGISTVSLEEADPKRFNLYPNPTKSSITIDGEEVGEVSLLSTDGRTLHTWVKSDAPLTLNVSTLPSGVYFVRLSSDDYQQTQKLIVE